MYTAQRVLVALTGITHTRGGDSARRFSPYRCTLQNVTPHIFLYEIAQSSRVVQTSAGIFHPVENCNSFQTNIRGALEADDQCRIYLTYKRVSSAHTRVVDFANSSIPWRYYKFWSLFWSEKKALDCKIRNIKLKIRFSHHCVHVKRETLSFFYL